MAGRLNSHNCAQLCRGGTCSQESREHHIPHSAQADRSCRSSIAAMCSLTYVPRRWNVAMQVMEIEQIQYHATTECSWPRMPVPCNRRDGMTWHDSLHVWTLSTSYCLNLMCIINIQQMH
eukprot:jgi/Ulvmu1/9725/UM055_0065.1